MLVFLLGISEPTQVQRDPLVGGIFENLVLSEALKYFANRGRLPELYFFRDQHGLEVDCLFSDAPRFLGIEIKSAATPKNELFRSLRRFEEGVHPLAGRYLVYSGPPRSLSDCSHFVSFAGLAAALDDWLSKARFLSST